MSSSSPCASLYPLRDTTTNAPRLATPNARYTPSQDSGSTIRVLRDLIPENVAALASSSNSHDSVQHAHLPYIRKCRTRVQLEALDALRTLAEPFSIASAARDLGWDMREAKHWMLELSARGYLVAASDGHRWTMVGRDAK